MMYDKKKPQVTIYRSGVMCINDAASQALFGGVALEGPMAQSFCLNISCVQDRSGLASALILEPDFAGDRAARRQFGKSGYWLGAKSDLLRWGVLYSESKRYFMQVQGGVFGRVFGRVDLEQEADLVTRVVEVALNPQVKAKGGRILMSLGQYRVSASAEEARDLAQQITAALAATSEVNKNGQHRYPGDGDGFSTGECLNGCGCWMGPFRSGGPNGVDPFGACPESPSGQVANMSRRGKTR